VVSGRIVSLICDHLIQSFPLILQEYSERQLPHHRKLQLANKKAARGAASRYAPGTYSQAFGVISQKDLHALQHTKQ